MTARLTEVERETLPERPTVPTAGLVDAVARLQRSAAAVEAP